MQQVKGDHDARAAATASAGPVLSTATTAGGEDRRLSNLDLLRALAVVMVIIHHLADFPPWRGLAWLEPSAGWWSGVDIFFVLSGYLIGGLWHRERRAFGDVKVGRFLSRRWLRTIPPYLAALLITIAIKAVSGHPLGPLLPYFAFLQNYTTDLWLFGPSWSLCVEEHFYLLLPFVLTAISWGRVAMHAGCALLFMVPLVLRCLIPDQLVGNLHQHYYETHFHCEGLVLGVWIAYAVQREPGLIAALHRATRWLTLPALALILLGEHVGLTKDADWASTALALLNGALVINAVSGPPWLLAPWLLSGFLARHSYSIYLTHYMVIQLASVAVLRFLPALSWPAVALAGGALVVLAVAIGWGFALLCELPAIAWRDRICPRRR